MFRASQIFGAPAGPRGPASQLGGGRPYEVGASAPPPPAPPRPLGASARTGGSWMSGGGGGGGGGYGGYGPASRQPPAAAYPASYSPYGGGGSSPYGGGGCPQTSTQWRAKARPAMKPTPPPQPTPNTVVLLGAASLPQGVEKEIEDCARSICIENGFSTCDEVRYVSPSLAFIDFPYHEACRDFLRVTGGVLKVGHRSYKLQHSSSAPAPSSRAPAAPAIPVEEPTASDGTVLDHPTDTLMVRQIGDLSDNQVMKAFKMVVPTVKGVRLLMDRHTRKSKGFCFVSFWCVSEAETALARLTAMGSMIEGRKVSISFAKPQTHEQMLESDMHYRNEQNEIQAQQQQALGGINADMWANYFSFCTQEKEKEQQATAARAAAARAAQEEAARMAEERAAALQDPEGAPLDSGEDAGGSMAAAGGDAATMKPPAPGGGAATGSNGFAVTGGSSMTGPAGAMSMAPPLGGAPGLVPPLAVTPSEARGAATPKAPSGAFPGGPGLPGGMGMPGGTGPSVPLGGPGAPAGATGPAGMPNLPGLPPLGNLPGMPNLSGMPNLPGLSLPGAPGPGGATGNLSSLGGLPPVGSIPGLAGLPGMGPPPQGLVNLPKPA